MKHRLCITPLLVCFSLFCSLLSFGQGSRLFKGSNSHINQIIYDHAGYVWIATDNGLTRFDGFNSKTFTRTPESPSLLSNIVLAVMEDKANNIWVGTNDGIQKFDRTTETFETPRLNYPGIPEFTYVNSIIEDSRGNIWFTTSRSGLICFPADNGRPRCYLTTNSTIASDKTTVVFEDKFGNIWVGTNDNGLSMFNPSNNSMVNFSHDPSDPASLSGNMIHSIAQTNDGQLFVASLDGGIDSYNYRTNKFTRNAIPVPGKVFVLENDPANNILYIGTDGNGAFAWHLDKDPAAALVPIAPDVKDFDMRRAKIHDIVKDPKGNIWAAVYQQGALFIPNSNEHIVNYGFNPFSPSHNIGNNPVLSILKDSGGMLWIATDGDGIYRRGADGKFSHFSDNDLKSNIILCVFEDSKGRIWAASYFGGLARFDAARNSFVPVPISDNGRPVTDINTIAEDKNGCLWLGTNGWGTVIYNPDSGAAEFLKHSNELNTENQIAGNSIQAILFDRRGKAWLGSSDAGISVYDPASGNFEQYNILNRRLNNNTIYSIVEDRSGNIWIGTAAGLTSISDGKTAYYNEPAGIPETPVYGIVLDNDGNLWLSNSEGISNFSLKQRKVVRKLPPSRLGTREFKRGAAYIDDAGRIYFGGVGGVASFLPSALEAANRLSNVEFSDISWMQRQDNGSEKMVSRPVTGGEEIELDYGSNSFTVTFGAMEYGNPEDVQYFVLLENYKDEWEPVPSGTQSVSFSKVPPGNYVLRVRAVLGDSTVENFLKIRIRPPFYLTWWAKCIYALLAILLLLGIVLFVQFKSRRKIENMRLRNEEKSNREKLRFFTDISHEVRTPLTLILGPIQSLKKATADKKILGTYEMMESNGERILRLLDQILDLRKFDNEKVRLQVMPTDIRLFIRRICDSFANLIQAKSINFELSFADDVPSELLIDRDKIDKVVFNVIANAIRFTPEGGRVSVVADLDGTANFRIKISDSGPGIAPENRELIFERFFQVATAGNSGGSGIGLHLSRMMMRMHHGDIFVEESSASGSTFAIVFPASADAYSPQEIMPESSPISDLKETHLPLVGDEANVKVSTARKSNSVLVVEDDVTILNYVADALSSDYNVLTATDGEKALRLTLLHRPHCVVTDIMMQGMDGLELLRKIRSNPDICEIPVVMLTAKASEAEQIEGFEAGADAYIVKPFKMDTLKARVSSLIHTRRVLRQKLTKSEKVNEEVAAMKSDDQKLMEKMEAVVVKELANPELNVEFIASEIGVSRSHLHRRLRDIANISPSVFIKQARMRHAAILLTEKRMSVSETAYATGFNSLSHFSTAFKDYFGMTPTQYVVLYKRGDISEIFEDKS